MLALNIEKLFKHDHQTRALSLQDSSKKQLDYLQNHKGTTKPNILIIH